MDIEVLDQKPCEGVFSSRDSRYMVMVDSIVRVQLVKCEHRDHPRLGDIKIENVKVKDRVYAPEELDNLPEEYSESNLYRILIQFL